MRFYNVDNIVSLVIEQSKHIDKLQNKLSDYRVKYLGFTQTISPTNYRN